MIDGNLLTKLLVVTKHFVAKGAVQIGTAQAAPSAATAKSSKKPELPERSEVVGIELEPVELALSAVDVDPVPSVLGSAADSAAQSVEGPERVDLESDSAPLPEPSPGRAPRPESDWGDYIGKDCEIRPSADCHDHHHRDHLPVPNPSSFHRQSLEDVGKSCLPVNPTPEILNETEENRFWSKSIGGAYRETVIGSEALRHEQISTNPDQVDGGGVGS